MTYGNYITNKVLVSAAHVCASPAGIQYCKYLSDTFKWVDVTPAKRCSKLEWKLMGCSFESIKISVMLQTTAESDDSSCKIYK